MKITDSINSWFDWLMTPSLRWPVFNEVLARHVSILPETQIELGTAGGGRGVWMGEGCGGEEDWGGGGGGGQVLILHPAAPDTLDTWARL